ncbi:MAG: hypothetical protein NVS3B12_24890 [Acidimicrobiales bacterium]
MHVEVGIEHLDDQVGVKGVSRDVSAGGIRVWTDSDSGVDGPVFVVIGQRGRVFAAMGCVVTSRAAADGTMTETRIRFENQSPQSVASINRFLDHVRSDDRPDESTADHQEDSQG